MLELPKISGDEAIKIFKKLGFFKCAKETAMLSYAERITVASFPGTRNSLLELSEVQSNRRK